MGEKITASLKISGMHCATCSVTIEDAIASIGEGTTGQANFGTDSAWVDYDPANVTLQDIEKVVREAGYDVIHDEVIIKVGGMVCATCVETIWPPARMASTTCVC